MLTLNQRTVTAKLQRINICDLLIACDAVSNALKNEGKTSKKWDDLHDKLKSILDDFDSKQKDLQ